MANYIWNTFLLLVCAAAIVIALAIWRFQANWSVYFEDFYYDVEDHIDRWRHGEPNGRYGFLRDRGAGLSSSNFDLEHNIENNDTRAGLDERAKKTIRRIMRRDPTISFDDARVLYTTQQFANNGIAPDGRPTDPRALYFS